MVPMEPSSNGNGDLHRSPSHRSKGSPADRPAAAIPYHKDAATLENLPAQAWDHIQAEWEKDAAKARGMEDDSMNSKYRTKMDPLLQKQVGLMEEALRIENEAKANKEAIERVREEIDRVEVQFAEAQAIVVERRARQDEEAHALFRFGKAEALKREHGGHVSEAEAEAMDLDEERPRNPETPDSDTTVISQPSLVERTSVQANGGPSSSETTRAEVWDHEGNFLARIKKLEGLDNRFVRNLLQLPIKRRVRARPGRKFTLERLNSIYEPSDVKGAKWISAMIQATGEEQETPCTSCRKRAGTWVGCMIVGGSDYPRCANCEWHRQGCNGSSYHMDNPLVANTSIASPPNSHSHPASPLPASGFNNPASPNNSVPPSPLAPPLVHSNSASREGSSVSGFTPVNAAQLRAPTVAAPARVPHRRTALPTGQSSRTSLPSAALSAAEPKHDADDNQSQTATDPGPDITKAGLHLRHDGVVYTEPIIMRGVPVERIGPEHPYWKSDWEPVEPVIQAKLTEWETKLQSCIDSGKNRFMAGRQVNRGRATMKLLKEADFYPYQLIGKPWITKKLVSYDTISRLAQVIEELPKLNVGITPLEWVRERMHELYVEQGDDQFNLAAAINSLYHDPKLVSLRSRAGFGNIGRPSGVKKGMTSKGGIIRPKDPHEPTTRKRKGRASGGGHGSVKGESASDDQTRPCTPDSSYGFKKQRIEKGHDAGPQSPTYLGQQTSPSCTRSAGEHVPVYIKQQPGQPISPASAQSAGYRIPIHPGAPPIPARPSSKSQQARDDHYDEGYTSHDSSSGDTVCQTDWRVAQVKTEDLATSTSVTQYWHWVTDGPNAPYFEHQVLQSTKPRSWKVYEEPTDFHLRLQEIAKIQYAYNLERPKIFIHTRPVPNVEYRGMVMAEFKRARTLRRFIQFLKDQVPTSNQIVFQKVAR